jgi:hypothetical protein
VSMRARASLNRAVALLASGLLGAGAAFLASCGSGNRLIPVANSEPLQRDFEEVAHAAETAHGSCSATEATLAKAQADLSGLPSSVDAGLRRRLGEGLDKLRADALEVCGQPSAGSTVATTVPPATTQTSTQATTPTTTTKTSTTPGGGTAAKEEKDREKEEEREKEREGEAGGTKAKEKSGGDGASPGNGVLPNGGQEGGK